MGEWYPTPSSIPLLHPLQGLTKLLLRGLPLDLRIQELEAIDYGTSQQYIGSSIVSSCPQLRDLRVDLELGSAVASLTQLTALQGAHPSWLHAALETQNSAAEAAGLSSGTCVGRAAAAAAAAAGVRRVPAGGALPGAAAGGEDTAVAGTEEQGVQVECLQPMPYLRHLGVGIDTVEDCLLLAQLTGLQSLMLWPSSSREVRQLAVAAPQPAAAAGGRDGAGGMCVGVSSDCNSSSSSEHSSTKAKGTNNSNCSGDYNSRRANAGAARSSSIRGLLASFLGMSHWQATRPSVESSSSASSNCAAACSRKKGSADYSSSCSSGGVCLAGEGRQAALVPTASWLLTSLLANAATTVCSWIPSMRTSREGEVVALVPSCTDMASGVGSGLGMQHVLSLGLGEQLTRLRFHGAWEVSKQEVDVVKAGCPRLRDFVSTDAL